MAKSKVIVVLPAYNASKTLEKTLKDLPYDVVDEVILVDDKSSDDTVAVARTMIESDPHLVFEKKDQKSDKVLLTIFQHDLNRGYGANQKTCYSLALERGADIIVMLHPDYQYDPKLVPYFVNFIRDGYFDVMLGSRIRSRHESLAGGMPRYKYFANRILTLWQNIVTGQNLSEWHTGMRAYNRKVLEGIDFMKLSDDFVFDSQMLFRIAERKYLIGDIPVPVRYFADASSINLGRSIRYGLGTLWESFKFIGRKIM